jgi:hypothetical protein
MESIGGFLVIGWRIASMPPSMLWRDWVVILSVYVLVCPRTPFTRSWSIVTALTSMFLLGIYAFGQIPWTMSIFRVSP